MVLFYQRPFFGKRILESSRRFSRRLGGQDVGNDSNSCRPGAQQVSNPLDRYAANSKNGDCDGDGNRFD